MTVMYGFGDRANFAPAVVQWGQIQAAVFVLGRRALVDLPTILMALATLAVIVKARKIPEPVVIAVAGLVGMFVSPLARS